MRKVTEDMIIEDEDIVRTLKTRMDEREHNLWWEKFNSDAGVHEICHWCMEMCIDTQCKGDPDANYPACKLWEYTQYEEEESDA